MGDCYFMKNYTNYRGEIQLKDSREDLITRSEDVGQIIQDSPLRIIDGTYGIWYYESDLWNEFLEKNNIYVSTDKRR